MTNVSAGGGLNMMNASLTSRPASLSSGSSFSGSYGFSPRAFNRPAAQYMAKSAGESVAGFTNRRDTWKPRTSKARMSPAQTRS